MHSCSVVRRVEIVPGGRGDFEKLACWHYRDTRLAAYSAIYAMRLATETVGVIVYAMPSIGCELRNAATGNIFAGLDRRTRLALVNKNIRRIARVIIEPRLRGLGLATRLVRETMPKVNVPIVEALAVMGHINPFFEKAGMKAYKAPLPARCAQMAEAFSLVGIEQESLAEPAKVQKHIEKLDGRRRRFIEQQMDKFLQSYGKSRFLPAGPRRTAFVLNRLSERPVYYIWFNRRLSLCI